MISVFLKKQAFRIASNYVRMLLTFLIGIVIIRDLTHMEEGLYSTYVLVVVGLGFGVMMREVIRAAIVPFIGHSLSLSGEVNGYGKSIFIASVASIVYFAIVLLIVFFRDVFDVNPLYIDTFSVFVLLRGVAHILLLLQTPALNMLAVSEKMGLYNTLVFFERVGELVAVELIYYSVFSDNYADALVINGVTVLLWNFVLVVLVATMLKVHGRSLMFKLNMLDKNDWKFLRKQVAGNIFLVINMAFYFRFSIVLVNVLFGELASAIYGISTQIIGYLRQAVMGLVTGIDSYFSKNIKNKRNTQVNEQLFVVGEINSVLVIFAAMCMYVALPYIVSGVVSGELSDYIEQIVFLGNVFLVGVVARSLSEHWMSYMSGIGKVKDYSILIFFVSTTTPVVIVFLWFYDIVNPLQYLAYHFVLAMIVSHMLVIPLVIRKCEGVSIDRNYKSILRRVFFYSFTLLVIEMMAYFVVGNVDATATAVVVFLAGSALFLIDSNYTYKKIMGMN